MYIKIASVIEILLGLALGGFGGFLLFVVFFRPSPGPAGIIAFYVGIPMILLSVFLIIFGISLWKYKKWAWLPSIIILVLVIALFVMLGFLHPTYFLGSASAIVGLILLILGRKIFSTFPQIK